MKKIQLINYTNSLENEWDEFINQSLNGTIFHERKFISYHKDKFKDSSLIFAEDEKIIGVFPAAILEKEGKKILKSHPGTSYGGLVISEKLHLNQCFEIFSLIDDFADQNNITSVEFRHAPKIFNKNLVDQLEFAALHSNYIREDEELATFYYLAELGSFTEIDLIEYYENPNQAKLRQNYKKAIKCGLTTKFLKSSEEIDIFYNILEKNLLKHKTKPIHTLEEIKLLIQLYPERVKIWGVMKDNKILAGFFIFNINQLGWHIFYSSLDYDFTEFKPIHFGLIKLKLYLFKLSYKILNYGISTENGGRYINKTLFEFKESFNGTGALRTYWKKTYER